LQAELAVPQTIFFGIAAIVSLGTLGYKAKLFVDGIRSFQASPVTGRIMLYGVEVPAELAQLAPIKELKKRLDENRLACKKLYSAAALGAFEGT
jgi:hypothetical protein